MTDYSLLDGIAGDDLLIAGGDIVPAESTTEHQRQLLLNDKGDFKENPTTCIGLFGYLDNDDLQALARDVVVAYTQDGMKVNNIQLSQNGNLAIDANYK